MKDDKIQLFYREIERLIKFVLTDFEKIVNGNLKMPNEPLIQSMWLLMFQTYIARESKPINRGNRVTLDTIINFWQKFRYPKLIILEKKYELTFFEDQIPQLLATINEQNVISIIQDFAKLLLHYAFLKSGVNCQTAEENALQRIRRVERQPKQYFTFDILPILVKMAAKLMEKSQNRSDRLHVIVQDIHDSFEQNSNVQIEAHGNESDTFD